MEAHGEYKGVGMQGKCNAGLVWKMESHVK